MTTLQLYTNLFRSIIETQLVKALTIDLLRTDATELFGRRKFSLRIKHGRTTLCFMNPPHHKGPVDITFKEINHHNFSNSWMQPDAIRSEERRVGKEC